MEFLRKEHWQTKRYERIAVDVNIEKLLSMQIKNSIHLEKILKLLIIIIENYIN